VPEVVQPDWGETSPSGQSLEVTGDVLRVQGRPIFPGEHKSALDPGRSPGKTFRRLARSVRAQHGNTALVERDGA